MKVVARVARIAQRCVPAVATMFLLGSAAPVTAEEAVNTEGVPFPESAPVSEESLAAVRGAGTAFSTHPLPRGDVAVILWDEQPKARPAQTQTDSHAGSQTQQTTVRVR